MDDQRKHFSAFILDLEQKGFNEWLDEVEKIKPLKHGADYLVLYRASLSPQEAIDFLKKEV